MKLTRERAIPLALALGVGLALAVIAAAHPGLRFVDFLSFANRAFRLREGQDLVNGLYPIGYPALLLGGRLLLGDVLVAGKALAVLAGLGAALAARRAAGTGPALAMAALPAFLAWGSTEGTDLPAAALGLAAVALAGERPALAGLLCGLGCLMRYTGIAALPAVLLLAPSRGRALGAFALATLPHWGLALALGLPLLPDQSQNMAIGAGGPRPGPGGLLAHLPGSAARAAWEAWGSPWGALGLAGLLVGILRRERVAGGLLLWAALHVLGVALAFSNARLVLPATLAAGLGLGWLLPARARPWLVLPAALAILAQLPAALRVDADERALAEVAATPAPAPTLSTSPLYHQRRDGWLLGAANVRALGGDPRRLSPEALLQAARARGFRSLAVEAGRIGSFPALSPLLRDPPPEGYTLLVRAGSWRVYALEGARDHSARSWE